MKNAPRRAIASLLANLPASTSVPTVATCAGLKATDRAAREEILHGAYAIWEREGRPHDRKLANWLEAEAAVMRRA